MNLSALSSTNIGDYTQATLYTMALYSLTLHKFMNVQFQDDVENLITEFIIITFMKLFGKKHGLTGSYKSLIPILQAASFVYVNASMFNKPINADLLARAGGKFNINAANIENIKNCNNIIDFFKTLKVNNVMPISENTFSLTIINLTGVNSLTFFEDTSRHMAGQIASSVAGNDVFSRYYMKMNKPLYDRIVNTGINYLRK
jgi:hypothetical protein